MASSNGWWKRTIIIRGLMERNCICDIIVKGLTEKSLSSSKGWRKGNERHHQRVGGNEIIYVLSSSKGWQKETSLWSGIIKGLMEKIYHRQRVDGKEIKYRISLSKGWWKRFVVKYHHQRTDGKDYHHQRADGKEKSGYVLIKGLMGRKYYVMYAYDAC